MYCSFTTIFVYFLHRYQVAPRQDDSSDDDDDDEDENSKDATGSVKELKRDDYANDDDDYILWVPFTVILYFLFA